MSTSRSRTGKIPQISDAAVVGAVVRQVRKAHGLTQSELAGLAGTGVRFVSELERGKPNVALDKVLAVLAVLGLRLQAVEAEP